MGTLDQHIVVVRIPGAAGGRLRAADRVPGAALQGSPEVADIQYRLPNPLEMMDEILPRALLLLTPAELDRVAAALADERIAQSMTENRQTLRTPQGIAARELVQNDPFHLAADLPRPVRGGRRRIPLDASSGYFLSSDHSTLLMLVQPRRPAQDIPFGQPLHRRRRAGSSARRWRTSARPPGRAAAGIGYTGGYAISLYDAELIRRT